MARIAHTPILHQPAPPSAHAASPLNVSMVAGLAIATRRRPRCHRHRYGPVVGWRGSPRHCRLGARGDD